MLPFATLKIPPPIIMTVDETQFFIRTIEAAEVVMRQLFSIIFFEHVDKLGK